MSVHKTITRRSVLRIVAAAGIGGLTLHFGMSQAQQAQPRLTDTRVLMGTLVNLTIVSDDAASARAALDATLDRMQKLERVLTRFDPASEVSRLNRTGRLDQPSTTLVAILRQAYETSRITGGAFDITVEPLVTLYQQAFKDGGLPAPDAVRAALARVGYEALRVEENAVEFTRPGMGITLDGIAKGAIVDAGVAVLRERGYDNVLVEAGGDLLAEGQRAPDVPWNVGIESPRKAQQPGLVAAFTLTDRAIATSGDYMQPFTPDFLHHHILDPRTGDSPPELASASVFAPTAAQADALATALMVLGVQKGLALIETLPGCQALLITKTLTRFASSGLT